MDSSNLSVQRFKHEQNLKEAWVSELGGEVSETDTCNYIQSHERKPLRPLSANKRKI